MGEVEFFSFYKKIETKYIFIITFNLYIMVEDYRNAAIAQLNHALSTLTAAVDIETVRHHLDYVKTRLTQYIHTAEAVLEIKDGLLIANESEINTLKREIQRLQKENLALKEKQNSLPGGNLRAPVDECSSKGQAVVEAYDAAITAAKDVVAGWNNYGVETGHEPVENTNAGGSHPNVTPVSQWCATSYANRD